MKALALIAGVCIVVVMSLAYYALDAFDGIEAMQTQRLNTVQRSLERDDTAIDKAMIARQLELNRMRKAIAQGRRP